MSTSLVATTGPDPAPNAPAGNTARVATFVSVTDVDDPLSAGPVSVVRARTVAFAGEAVKPATLCQFSKLPTEPNGPLISVNPACAATTADGLGALWVVS